MEEGNESEHISDHFICAVCLDVLFKPIVLVCGHVTCFWCCHRSMDLRGQSHCPLCRHPYRHFPAICQMLHILLKNIYPISYARRKKQTLEDEEQNLLAFSPDVDHLVTGEELNHPSIGDPPSNFSCEDNLSIKPSPTEEKKSNEGSSAENCKQVTVAEVLCAACKQLLFQPVVLNCGHVYCEACIMIPEDGVIKCGVCEGRHPSGVPSICKELDYFLEEQFPSEYALRKSSMEPYKEQIQNGNPFKGSGPGSGENAKKEKIEGHPGRPPSERYAQMHTEGNDEGYKFSYPTEDNFLQWWTIHGSKFHPGVGCDMCGMCPIIGDRYRCKDCKEKSGYDLCGDCLKTGSKLPGRFNQKHTPDHRLELVKPAINRDVIYRLLSGQLAVVSAARNRLNESSEFASSSLDNDNNDDGGVGGGDDDGSGGGSREGQSDNQPPT